MPVETAPRKNDANEKNEKIPTAAEASQGLHDAMSALKAAIVEKEKSLPPESTRELAARLASDHPHADLKFLVESLERSLAAYPDEARGSRRRLLYHVQATADTVRLLRSIQEALCR